VTADHLPPLTRDLLFVDSSKLMRWNHATSQIEILVGPETFGNFQAIRNIAFASIGPGPVLGSVLSFSVSEDGKKIAVVVADTAPDKYDLMLFDLPTRHLAFVYQGASQGFGLLDMVISPDGQWLAYIPQDVITTDTPVPTGTPHPMNLSQSLRPIREPDQVGWVARPLSGGGPRSGVIYAVRIDAPDERIEVGHCGEVRSLEFEWGCGGRGRLLWSPDNHRLVWNDAHGIWSAELGQQPQLLVSNSSGRNGNRAFSAWSVSPSGRYLLTWINYYEGGSQAIVDIQTRQVIDVPDTFEYPELVARVTWMRDERLFVIRRVTESGLDNYSLFGEVWHPDSANGGSLVRDETFPIPVSAGDFPFFTTPVQLDDGRLAFAVLNASNANYQTRGLYTFTPDDTMPHKANGLPPVSDYYYSDVFWSPDGSGAVVQGQQGGSLLYAPADGSALYDLRPVLGDNVCCFAWLKQSLRSPRSLR